MLFFCFWENEEWENFGVFECLLVIGEMYEMFCEFGEKMIVVVFVVCIGVYESIVLWVCVVFGV